MARRMYFRIFALVFLTSFLGTLALSESAVRNMHDTLKEAIKYLPAKTQRNFETYLRIVKPELYDTRSGSSIAEGNAGLSGYLSKKFHQPANACYREAAVNFYHEIERVEAQNQSPKQRPQLMSKTQQAPYEDFENGWLWKLALKHSNNNPNGAMLLIGLCGHDDVSQGHFNYLEKSPQIIEALKIENESLKRDIAEKSRMLQELVRDSESNQELITIANATIRDINTQILRNEALIQSGGAPRVLMCPDSQSAFYLPGGLGAHVDIPTELREKIRQIQGSGKANPAIAAKHYHVFGAALITCQMIEQGVDAENATSIQTQAARLYRGIRMCETSAELLQHRESLIRAFNNENDISFFSFNADKKYEEALRSLIQEFDQNRDMCIQSRISQYPQFKAAFCRAFEHIPYQASAQKGSIQKKLEFLSMRMDTAYLYRRWYLGGGEIFGKQVPCTDMRLGGPLDLMKPESFTGKLDKPLGWSTTRYNQATRHLATWDVDFEWTIAQHQVGASFAAKNCKNSSLKDSQFCKGKSQGVPVPPEVSPVRRGVSSEESMNPF